MARTGLPGRRLDNRACAASEGAPRGAGTAWPWNRAALPVTGSLASFFTSARAVSPHLLHEGGETSPTSPWEGGLEKERSGGHRGGPTRHSGAPPAPTVKRRRWNSPALCSSLQSGGGQHRGTDSSSDKVTRPFWSSPHKAAKSEQYFPVFPNHSM